MFSFLCFCLVFLFSAGPICTATGAATGAATPAPEPADAVEAHYRDSVAAFRKHLSALRGAAPDRRMRVLRDLRLGYKRLEFLAEYRHPGSAKRINGAPFPRADEVTPFSSEILEPEGLQVVYGLLDEDVPNDRALHAALGRIAEAAGELESQAMRSPWDDRMVFEAMEQQVIRVMTTGISGFDTDPKWALEESRVSLEAMRPAIASYLPRLRRRDAALAKRLSAALDRAVIRLRGGFDSFDRLAFLREAGNPLYAALLDAHDALHIATLADLPPLRRPVSVTARNLFAPDFLDAHYYAKTEGERGDSGAAALGRDLFFEPALSTDGRSCASCHNPALAFSDGVPKSAARGGHGTVARNAPGLSYAAYQASQFWDMRAETLELQIGHVVMGSVEFDSDFRGLLERLRAAGYAARFARIFPGEGDPLAAGALTKSLALYVRSLGRWDSPFDRYARGESDTLDPAARRGFNLFMGKALCATCHFPPAFNGTVPPRYLETESEVLGTPESFPAAHPRLDADPGRFALRPSPVWRGAFKTPTVRNAARTAPYMHNGGIGTLEAVIDFYDAGGGRGLGLDVPYQTLPADSLGLSRREKTDLVAFLQSLDDGPEKPRAAQR